MECIGLLYCLLEGGWLAPIGVGPLPCGSKMIMIQKQSRDVCRKKTLKTGKGKKSRLRKIHSWKKKKEEAKVETVMLHAEGLVTAKPLN